MDRHCADTVKRVAYQVGRNVGGKMAEKQRLKQPLRVCRRNRSWQKGHHLVEDLSRALRRERLHIKECAGFVMVGGLVGGQERLLQLRVRGS